MAHLRVTSLSCFAFFFAFVVSLSKKGFWFFFFLALLSNMFHCKHLYQGLI